MTFLQAFVLGMVEGMTEFLPVSSTGHLLLAKQILGLDADPTAKTALDAYLIIIQIGAILAVLSLYWKPIQSMILGLFGRDPDGLRLLLNLLVAFVPAAVTALCFEGVIKEFLFGLWPVTAAWFVGGVALILFGPRSRDRAGEPALSLADLTPRKALLVGLWQILALLPGTSRSLVTILGGRIAGLTLRDSVVFSFLLGALTLGAATAYDLLKHGRDILEHLGAANLAVGVLTAGVAAALSVRFMVGYLGRHGVAAFGVYRVALGILTAFLLWRGVLAP